MTRVRLVLALPACAVLTACASVQVADRAPTRLLGAPDTSLVRKQVLEQTAMNILSALRTGNCRPLLFRDSDLHTFFQPEAATRIALRRAAYRPTTNMQFEALGNATYSGICIQNARVESSDSTLGLMEPSWVFDRALVAATGSHGRRLALWIEGAFVYTDAGFRAIRIDSIEAPRWEHSDLELATCDMVAGMQ